MSKERNTGSARRTIRSIDDLQECGLVSSGDREDLEKVMQTFSVAITPGIMSTISSSDPASGVARQFVPSVEELNVSEEELTDPIGDQSHSPVKGIIHRYPDRVLLNALHTCAVYCRFCFRREKVGNGQKALNKDELNAAIAYIRNDKQLWEVILSGGDPLTLSPSRIAYILSSLSDIQHVGVMRIHTRVPVVAPNLVTSDMIDSLVGPKPVYVVLHINHPDEITSDVSDACARLIKAGMPLLSQSVLLRGINDDEQTLIRLFRRLVENKIKPYYLHHGDLARGTSHFRTRISVGQDLMRSLRGSYSGLCQPTYVLDIPGGHGKVPIGPSYINSTAHNEYKLTDVDGAIRTYTDKARKGSDPS